MKQLEYIFSSSPNAMHGQILDVLDWVRSSTTGVSQQSLFSSVVTFSADVIALVKERFSLKSALINFSNVSIDTKDGKHTATAYVSTRLH